MTEVLFYHLTQRPLEDVLPGLLETCLQRSWKVVVQAGSPERCAALDSHLWTYREDGFLPHGTSADGHASAQPVYLTAGAETPNGATVRFMVDRAAPPDLSPFERGVFLFDGNDPEAVAEARQYWKTLKAAGHDLTYWQQSNAGRWERKA
ncbi:DNA polymerase III subunit chi [Stappia sp.]|jgi:DNA polymerase-3 subunit chi|uniref:DNA polymerase III subunit chi n=1 Tax=Stappia sp. TaxID=1870903 RepID=UPI003A9A61EC